LRNTMLSIRWRFCALLADMILSHWEVASTRNWIEGWRGYRLQLQVS
jgi:hypothetical protein